MSKTCFKQAWLLDSTFMPWLQPVQNSKFSAFCKLCHSSFALSNMGKLALVSHMKGKKHVLAVQASSSCLRMERSFFSESGKSVIGSSSIPITSDKRKLCEEALVNSELNINSVAENKSNISSIQSFLLPDIVTKAEICWCLNSVKEHLSFRSSSRYLDFCKTIFNDSGIAEKMQLSRTKIAYMITHGLGPYFKNALLNDLKNCSHVVVGFDESLNKISQSNQMDLSVRYWNSEKNEVSTRYITSAFLGHSTSSDILEAFINALSGIKLSKMIQISVDGPNVNLKFLRLLREELRSMMPLSPVILELGSCGLHTVHCAFKWAIKTTGWNVVEFLRALHNLFKNVPARRADYIKYTESDTFPKKFCTIRWVENKDVASRAIEILPNIKKFVECCKSNQNVPQCKSFEIVSGAVTKDAFLEAKLVFFKALAEEVEPFLLKFQDDAPLAQFLFYRLLSLTISIAERFVKPEILMKKSPVNIDLELEDNIKPSKNVSIGYDVKVALKNIKKSQVASELRFLEFKNDCRSAYIKLVQKLCERSPLKFKLTKAISILDPSVFVDKALISKYLPLCLEILVENNWISGNVADKIDSQFKKLSVNVLVIEKMKSYKQGNSRLDHHWVDVISMVDASQELKNFVQMLLILSHGNASLERGFSINKECIIENQKEGSIVALRQVYGAVQQVVYVSQLNITKDMITAARNSRSLYVADLKRQKEQEKSRIIEVKERKGKSNEIKVLQAKKLKIQMETNKELAEVEKEIEKLKQNVV